MYFVGKKKNIFKIYLQIGNKLDIERIPCRVLHNRKNILLHFLKVTENQNNPEQQRVTMHRPDGAPTQAKPSTPSSKSLSVKT